jgi:hypothetical protein
VAFRGAIRHRSRRRVHLAGLFWSLRLGENPILTAMQRPPPTPLRYLRRFFVQPWRLAWTLATARASWWSMFYVYAPIFAATYGLDAETGGPAAVDAVPSQTHETMRRLVPVLRLFRCILMSFLPHLTQVF